jgi:beta-galactosidase
MEGKEIAVWVHSNLDKVELLFNGESLGTKDVKKDSHLAWIVKYAPGTIEARGFKDGKLVMTTKRETTGAAAKLVVSADRLEVSADGEDVAMFAVEVRDAQDRVVPVTDSEVTFRVTGEGKLIGTGNGDPTNQEPDKGTSRKAFSGLCMGLVQSTKTAGNITVEVTSPGLAPGSATIAAKGKTLRPQVAAWERAVPVGSGITGLWRPMPAASVPGQPAYYMGGGSMVFSLQQNGNDLTGSAEGAGGDATPITEGKVDGSNISFKAGYITFTGKLKGDQIELQRAMNFPSRPQNRPPEPVPTGPRPAIGPAPDGSDPSSGPRPAGRAPQTIPVIVLHRVQR